MRNREDGTVEAVFEGPQDAVSSLVDFCHQGPRGAFVEDVHVAERDAEGLRGFEVR